MNTAIGLTLVIGGIGWLLFAGGRVYLKEWREGRNQGFPRSRA